MPVEWVFLICANFTPNLHLVIPNYNVCCYSLLKILLIYHNVQNMFQKYIPKKSLSHSSSDSNKFSWKLLRYNCLITESNKTLNNIRRHAEVSLKGLPWISKKKHLQRTGLFRTGGWESNPHHPNTRIPPPPLKVNLSLHNNFHVITTLKSSKLQKCAAKQNIALHFGIEMCSVDQKLLDKV